MERAIFILYLFVAITMSLSDDVTERAANALSMSQIDVQTCMNKTNVKPEDLMRLDQLIDDSVRTPDIDNSVLEVGCLFACLLQKKEIMSGPHINSDKIKELMDSKRQLDTRFIDMRNRILDTCTDRVKSKTDECEVTLKFLLCVMTEATPFMGI